MKKNVIKDSMTVKRYNTNDLLVFREIVPENGPQEKETATTSKKRKGRNNKKNKTNETNPKRKRTKLKNKETTI